MTNALPCAVCGASDGKVLFDAKGLGSEDPRFHLRRCLRCGLGWTEPRLSDSEIGRWYPHSYYGKDNVRFNILFELLVRIFRKRRAKVISSRVPVGTIL